jgi:hypothetical protein
MAYIKKVMLETTQRHGITLKNPETFAIMMKDQLTRTLDKVL